MSIIYDALKKVEQSREVPTKANSGVEKPKPRLKIYLAYTLALFLGIWITNGVFALFSKPGVVNQASKEDIYNYAPVSPDISKVASSIPLTKADFALNGIFFSEDEGFALINNQIVKEGDVVNGAKVLRISVNAVELDSQGSVIKLSSGG